MKQTITTGSKYSTILRYRTVSFLNFPRIKDSNIFESGIVWVEATDSWVSISDITVQVEAGIEENSGIK